MMNPETIGFRDGVRQRDRRCVISGRRVFGERFESFRAAHIFLRSYADAWEVQNFASYITDDAPASVLGANKLDSVQNGLLLSSDAHEDWVSYGIGIDVDDDYKVVVFGPDPRFDGDTLFLDPSCPSNHLPTDALLRDHFRQCLLANVRGPCERDSAEFDRDVQEGDEDLALEEWNRPTVSSKSWAEIELANRLL